MCSVENCQTPHDGVQTSGITDLHIPLCRFHMRRLRARNAFTATSRQYYRNSLTKIFDYPGVCYVLELHGELSGAAKVGFASSHAHLPARLRDAWRRFGPHTLFRLYPGGAAVEDYFQHNLIDGLIEFGTSHELYDMSPEFGEVVAWLDEARQAID
jgi:hypothetical protein